MPKRKNEKKEKVTTQKEEVADNKILHTQHIQIEMEPITDVGTKVRLFFSDKFLLLVNIFQS